MSLFKKVVPSLSKVRACGIKPLPLAGQVRHSSARVNTVVLFVPQQEAWIIERFGKFSRTLTPGLNFLLPVVDQIKYIQSLKEIAIDIPEQSAITADNVALNIDGVLYLKIFDPEKTSYGVQSPEYAVTQLAQTTMRSEIGKIELDTVFRERERLNIHIVDAINKASEAWGISCLRYEIKDITLPERIGEAMQMQVEAERKKRASILQSEGRRAAEINVAEGRKTAQILASEAFQQEKINQAEGEAKAVLTKASAKAEALQMVASAIGKHKGPDAVSLSVAEGYIEAFGNLAKKGNTVLLPADTGNMSSMVSQAMTIYKTVNSGSLAESDSSSDSSSGSAAATTVHHDPSSLNSASSSPSLPPFPGSTDAAPEKNQ